MAVPVVAIVGRPNVGKSSLFNCLSGRRTSIVEPTAGVTRDRVSTILALDEVYCELVDTGGHGMVDRDDLEEHVERQILYAIDQARLILLVVDAKEGLTPLDRDTAELLRRHEHAEHVRLIANKVDGPHLLAGLGEFIKLGFGEAMPVSAVHGNGRDELREVIKEAVRDYTDEAPVEPVMKIALVGRRNVGKSSFINALAGEERVIVSEIPGTTRDSIDVRIEKDGRVILAIDTAGLRKRARIADAIEFYAVERATRSIRRADVILFLIDATEPVGQVDKSLAHLIAGEHKPCVLVVNKWDLAKGKAGSDDYGEYLTKTLPELDYAPIAFTSAPTGRNIYSTLDLAAELFKQSRTRVGTSDLNDALRAAVAAHAPSSPGGRKTLKLLYAAQVSTQPPTIVVFVNDPERVKEEYQRYLTNRFREMLPFGEIPIRLLFRSRRATPAER
jgi:GTP-binding protein